MAKNTYAILFLIVLLKFSNPAAAQSMFFFPDELLHNVAIIQKSKKLHSGDNVISHSDNKIEAAIVLPDKSSIIWVDGDFQETPSAETKPVVMEFSQPSYIFSTSYKIENKSPVHEMFGKQIQQPVSQSVPSAERFKIKIHTE